MLDSPESCGRIIGREFCGLPGGRKRVPASYLPPHPARPSVINGFLVTVRSRGDHEAVWVRDALPTVVARQREPSSRHLPARRRRTPRAGSCAVGVTPGEVAGLFRLVRPRSTRIDALRSC
jgi:hypothetical protein